MWAVHSWTSRNSVRCLRRWGSLCTAVSLRRALPLVAALLMLSSIGLPDGLLPWSLRAQRSGSGGGGGGGVGMAGVRFGGGGGTAQTTLADGDEDDTEEPGLVLQQVCVAADDRRSSVQPLQHATAARILFIRQPENHNTLLEGVNANHPL